MALPVADMDIALEAAGIPFVGVGYSPADPTGAADWRTRGRPASTGPFNPTGVLCHHTASPAGTSDHTDISVILAGNGSAPGPISQIYIGRSGVVYLIAAGRANHGGSGIRPGIDSSCSDMNAALLGIEAGNNGIGEPWGDAQTTVYAEVVNALCAFYGWPIDAVYLHATTGPPSGGCNSKIDPAGPWQREPNIGGSTWNLDIWRAFVDEMGGATPPPIPNPPEGDDLMAQPCGFISLNAGTVGHHVDGSEYRAPVDGTILWVSPAGNLQWIHGGEMDSKLSVEAAAGRRTDTWNTPVGTPDNFGRLEGDKPA